MSGHSNKNNRIWFPVKNALDEWSLIDYFNDSCDDVWMGCDGGGMHLKGSFRFDLIGMLDDEMRSRKDTSILLMTSSTEFE
jgi:hypothetical protein